MSERIYVLDAEGNLSEMIEERFDTEDALQMLIADHPTLLAGEQINPSDPPRFILVKREKGIADRANARHHRWAIDHVLIDQNAVPTLVEVKRGENTDIRRKVVGQMLEYAAHASQTWETTELRDRFEEDAQNRGSDPNDLLGQLLGEKDPDSDQFWGHVAERLAATRLRLLFVADQIPDELARIVAFLNRQMRDVEVLAVEIKQFRGETGQILVPHVIGRTAASQERSFTRPSPAVRTVASLLDQFSDPQARSAAERLIDAARGQGGVKIMPRARSITIRVACDLWPEKELTVAWLCVEPGVNVWEGTQDFSFGAADRQYTHNLDAALADRLDKWADVFAGDSFAKPLPKPESVRGHSIGYAAASANADLLAERLTAVLADLAAM